jgi:hypothetical protein
VDPQRIYQATSWFPFKPGAVRCTWPPSELIPFEEHTHVRFALAHWRDGMPWAQTGVYDYMLERIAARGRQDDCQNYEDVVLRFQKLDDLYATVKAEGRLRTRREICPKSFREKGGILVHIGPQGEAVAGDSGKHRLTIAKLVGLPVVPVQLGEIHLDAVRALPLLRQPTRA